jgi:hypothetical protein
MKRAAWRDEQADVGTIPTMISREERRYLHWLGRTQWRDAGHVVEIGPWLGGSTVCLASGMSAGHASPRHRLHVIDNFKWREFMSGMADLQLAAGESFEPNFRANVARFGDRIAVHTMVLPDESVEGDEHTTKLRSRSDEGIAPFEWPTSDPIEILFVDGAKSWRGIRHLLATVRSTLVPDALLVAQDYKYWAAYWVPLFLWQVRDSIERVHDVKRGSTVSFRLTRALDPQRIEAIPDHIAKLDLDRACSEIASAADALRQTGSDLGASQVALGQVPFLVHRGELDRAQRAFADACASWPAGADQPALQQARQLLESSGARDLAPIPKMSRVARMQRRLFRRS